MDTITSTVRERIDHLRCRGSNGLSYQARKIITSLDSFRADYSDHRHHQNHHRGRRRRRRPMIAP